MRLLATTVIVTDGMNRKALTAVRALGTEGYQVVVGETHTHHPTKWSRYVQAAITYPDPATDPEGFVACLIDAAKRFGASILMPMDDEAVIALSKHSRELPDFMKVAIPNPESLRITRDKAETMAFARDLGVPVPESCVPRSQGELEEFIAAVPGPYVFKPRIGSGSRGLAFPKSADNLRDLYISGEFTASNAPLVQSRIPQGRKFHVCVLYDRGRLVVSFTQEILRQFPAQGGPGTFWVTARDEVAEGYARTMFDRLNWHGIGMAEFVEHAGTTTCYLMEINPRFWNTLALSVHAGINFPYLLARVAEGSTIDAKLLRPRAVYCQWFFPGDLLNFLTSRSDRWMRPGHFAWVFGSAQGMPIRHVIWDRHDPWPLVGMLATLLRFVFSRDKWRHAIFRRP